MIDQGITIGDRVKMLRSLTGASMRALAPDIGIHYSTLQQLEQGMAMPDLRTIWKIADYFEVSIDYLVGREKQIKKEN